MPESVRAWKHLNTLISRWPSGQAELFDYSISHRTFTLRITNEGRDGNLIVGGEDCKFLSGPTRWRLGKLDFAHFPGGDPVRDEWALWDQQAGFLAVSWSLGASENVKRLGHATTYPDMIRMSGADLAAEDQGVLSKIREVVEPWAGNPVDLWDYSAAADGGLVIRTGPDHDLSQHRLIGIGDCRYFSGPTRWLDGRIQLTFEGRSKVYVVRDPGSNFVAVGTSLATWQAP